MSFSAKSRFKLKNDNLLFPLSLLLSGDLSLLVTFRALDLIHLNINSPLPIID